MISFTFDDFPRSAFINATPILAEYGVLATYYIASTLMGTSNELGEMFQQGDLEKLWLAGHELACHTLDHVQCCDLSDQELLKNCEENRDRVAEMVNGYAIRNFSYPNGVVTRAAKACLGSVYQSCRSSQPGINYDPVDMGFLRANPVYSRFAFSALETLIRRNTVDCGWLILYTHDVDPSYSYYGCTPEYFKAAVQCAVESGAEIKTVGAAMKQFEMEPVQT